MNFKTIAIAAVSALAIALPAWAHHSHANYQTLEWTQLKGQVREVHWLNPHVWVYLTVKDEKGEERFKKYLPMDRSFVNTIENYPYPYVIGKLCWEFPCMTPSDWQAQHLHKSNNPQTVHDWKAALDCTVIKQGVFIGQK